jgi:hypothetical protein
MPNRLVDLLLFSASLGFSAMGYFMGAFAHGLWALPGPGKRISPGSRGAEARRGKDHGQRVMT